MSKIRMAAGLGMFAMLAACSENSVAPRMDAANSSSVAGGGSTADLTSTDTARFSITINPWQTTYYYLGNGNMLTFPAHSLCALGSSYGPTEWDNPCTLATSSLTVNAKAWLDANGHARVDFDKQIQLAVVVMRYSDPANNIAEHKTFTFSKSTKAQQSWIVNRAAGGPSKYDADIRFIAYDRSKNREIKFNQIDDDLLLLDPAAVQP